MAGKSFKSGDKVKWDTSQGETHGHVVKKITKDMKIKSYTAKASKDDPKILVESEKTGAKAAHKPEELRKG
jgi:hypothetical protein